MEWWDQGWRFLYLWQNVRRYFWEGSVDISKDLVKHRELSEDDKRTKHLVDFGSKAQI